MNFLQILFVSERTWHHLLVSNLFHLVFWIELPFAVHGLVNGGLNFDSLLSLSSWVTVNMLFDYSRCSFITCKMGNRVPKFALSMTTDNECNYLA